MCAWHRCLGLGLAAWMEETMSCVCASSFVCVQGPVLGLPGLVARAFTRGALSPSLSLLHHQSHNCRERVLNSEPGLSCGFFTRPAKCQSLSLQTWDWKFSIQLSHFSLSHLFSIYIGKLISSVICCRLKNPECAFSSSNVIFYVPSSFYVLLQSLIYKTH